MRFSYRTRRRGAALITILAVILVLTITVAGVATFAVGHLTVASVRSDNAASELLEDAGINWGIQYVSSSQYLSPVPSMAPAPITTSIPGYSGNFKVWVTNVDGSSPWSPPNPILIHAIAGLNGEQREAQAVAIEESIFQPYTVIGIKSLVVSDPTTVISGNAATTGALLFALVPPTAITGDSILMGPFAGGPVGPTFFRRPGGITLPTIDQMVFGSLPVTSWGWLQSNAPINRSNPLVRQYRFPTVIITPLNFFTTQPAGAPWTGATAQGLTLTDALVGGLNLGPDLLPTIILPPGDYLFTDISLLTNVHVIVDTAGLTLPIPKPGLVRIWMKTWGVAAPDTIHATFTTTSPDPTLFRIYDSKPVALNLGSNVNFSGCIYATSAGSLSSVRLSGSNVVGSVVADNLLAAAGTHISAPASGVLGNVADYGVYVGLKSGWQEVPLPGQAVFPDGTNN